ncbi:uncharacterized protein FOMMEDRAFT_154460 [Fomitiporia mediterranea MF3/22]|uniref:uncharacterized protein n=1 Tax=Fomitiporia mediterranea (strain MF3/22) TaxID=694068 RepID=UPI0004409767|nr:uncharacterized protein FOMMEDRAFT_154460 [Fomitiporia mediterranea MF3/22]EJD05241.1 hypothetical protein FOMMEDRAFT_154460 [Fomitiporia mediterranea MF3/22]
MNSSPFGRLPVELIREIFQECIPESPSFKRTSAPLLLTHVCHTWRTISSDTPQFWSHIVVPRWQESVVGVDELVQLWLSRTQNAPLTIDFGLFSGRNVQACNDLKLMGELYPLMSRLLAALVPHRTRVRSLWGVFPTSFTPDVGIPEMINAERLFFYGLPKQDEMLRIREGESFWDTHKMLELGPARETLKVLSVCDCAVDINTVLLQTNLTHLELFDLHHDSGLDQETAFELLKSMPGLQKCVLELTKFERLDWRVSSPRMVLPNLELLFLLWNFPADIGLLLDGICTPNLIRLGLRGTPTMGPRAWSSLYNFLYISRAPLTRLSLGSFGDADLRLLDCLKCCSHLIQLSLNHCFIPESIFHTLACAHDSPLLPRLEMLNIVACAGLNAESIAAFMKSRAKDLPSGISRLKEVEIVNCLNITEYHMPLLHSCGVEKLYLKVTGDFLQ